MRKESSSSVKIFYPKFSKEELIKVIAERLARLNKRLPLKLVALFGSYARGNYTVASDVDLLVVYHGERREDAYALVKETFAVPCLEPHVYSEREYEEMKETIHRMVEGGVIMYFDSEEPMGFLNKSTG